MRAIACLRVGDPRWPRATLWRSSDVCPQSTAQPRQIA